MAREMFGDVVKPSISVGSKQWYTLPLSILAHVVIIGALIVIPLMATDILPTPPSMMAFVAAPPPPPPPPPPLAVPAAPGGLGATSGPGKKKITLTWSASSGAASYIVSRSATSGGAYSVVANGVAGTTYQNTGLASGSTYFYVVAATNTAGTSGSSNQASATAK